MAEPKPTHLSAREQARILKYIAGCLPLLRLDGWMIELVPDETSDDDEAHASIRTSGERRHAELRLATDWDKLDAERKRWVLMHECSHLLLRPMLHTIGLIEDDAVVHIGRIPYDLWNNAVAMEEEKATDEIARCLLPYAPVWPR